MFTPKTLHCGFIVLCNESKIDLVRYTVKSIRGRYADSPIICVTDNSINSQDLQELKRICPTFQGKNTFSSLINIGFKNAPADWNFVIIAGTTVRQNLDLKMSIFINSEKDILYPVAERKYHFHEATINGLMIHKKTFKSVGEWDTNLDLESAKALWASDAVEKGCKFKAVVGTKLC